MALLKLNLSKRLLYIKPIPNAIALRDSCLQLAFPVLREHNEIYEIWPSPHRLLLSLLPVCVYFLLWAVAKSKIPGELSHP